MKDNVPYMVFGPVPSRRLGRSLGINNIPPKVCTYSCVYCQLGKTLQMQVKRGIFYRVQEVVNAVRETLRKLQEKNETIDYLSFVPDGEPTLDLQLGEKIRQLKTLGIKIAVISNASLIWDKEVREDLKLADWISLKIDALTPSIWRKVDRPHRSLELEKILEGIQNFSQDFQGNLHTETMLVKDLNDQEEELNRVAKFISNLDIHQSYLSIPTRPPAVKWVKAPEPREITVAYQIFKAHALPVECLLGFAVQPFGSTGDIERDLLGITSVHPMRDSEIEAFLKKTGADRQILSRLIREKKLIQTDFGNQKFYIRNFSSDTAHNRI